MPSFAIISAANSKFFQLLRGLVLSIRRHPQGAGVPIGVLNVGLEPGEIAWLSERGVKVATPEWDFDFGEGKPPEYFKAMVSRPHLPKYFGGVDILIWIDSDAWVQDWSAIELLVAGAGRRGFAIVPEIDRSYTPFYDNATYNAHHHYWLVQCFDKETADKLYAYPLFNVGVFAARADAPHWSAWATLLADSFRRHIAFPSEQTALNVVLRTQDLPFSMLPSHCNWICYRALPFCSEDGGILLDPQLPHQPLGIVHMAGPGMKDQDFTLQTQGGATVTRSLQYLPPADGGAARPV